MIPHTLAHALRPDDTNCQHHMGDVTVCVVCNRSREHWTPFARVNYLDTCSRRCFRQLCAMQTEQRGPRL